MWLTDKPRAPGTNGPPRGKRWPEFLPGPPTGDQERGQLEANVQRLTEAVEEALPLVCVRWNGALRERGNTQRPLSNALYRTFRDILSYAWGLLNIFPS